MIERSQSGDTNAWIKLNDKYLKTTYREEKGEIIVISVVKKKTLPKEKP